MKRVSWGLLSFRYVMAAFMLFLSVSLLGCQRAEQSADLLATVKERGYLIVGVKFDSPPFGYMNAKSELEGFEIELVRDIAERILGDRTKVKFVQVQTATRIPTLQAKQVDFVAATMTITPDRAKIVHFTPVYYTAHQGALVKKDAAINSVTDLADKNVIFVIGGRGEENLRQKQPKAILMGFKSSTEAFSAFNAGRADAFTTDDTILNGFLAQNCGVRLIDDKFSDEPYGMAFRKDKASETLSKRVDEIVKNAQTSGYLDLLEDKWIQDTPPEHCE